MKIFAALLVILLGTAAAASAQTGGAGGSKKNYIHKLQLADRVRISVYQEPDLDTIARIDARGVVNLQLVGALAIGGMTIADAQAAIERAYQEGRFLRNPQVTVSVEEYAPRMVSVLGAVRQAGQYALPTESTFTVVEVITKAGGISDIGKGTAVSVTRVMPDGTKQVFTVDVDNVIKGKRGDGKIEDNTLLLQPGDIVYVPERLI
jgi:polysaccharide biosynthesis/export protein